MQLSQRSRVLIFSALVLAATAQTPAKRPLNHRDYDGWKAISNQVLSRDGKFLAYALFPEEGDGELVIRDLVTGKEFRENAGSVPPAPDTQNFEAPAADTVAARGLRITITADAKYAVSNAFPKKAETDQAKKDRKPAADMPKTSLMIVNLEKFHQGAPALVRVPDVTSYGIPENGPDYLAYLKIAKADAAATPTPAGNGDDADNDPANDPANDPDDVVSADQGRGGRGGGGGRGGAGRREFGSTLELRDLNTAAERTFEDVAEYVFAKDGKTFLFTVSSRKEETNGIYTFTPGSEPAPAALLAGKGKYSKIAFDPAQKQVAFVSDHDDPGAKPAKNTVYLWDRTAASPVVTPVAAVSTATPGFHADWGIADSGALTFSRDGARLYVNCAPLEQLAAAERTATPATGAAATPAGDEKLLADLWHWKDDYIQPMQKVRASQERNRTYRGVFHIADKKFVQLTDPTMLTVTPTDDGKLALGNDDRAYRHMVDYDGTYSDVYLVDTSTNARKLILKQAHGGGGGRGGAGGMQWSPDGKRILVFKDKDWYSIEAPDGKMVNMTANLGTNLLNEDHDTPDTVPAYGAGGWMKDSKEALIYDRYDVWAVKTDGSGGRRLTDGRAAGLQFRVARLGLPEDGEDRGIDPAKPLLFRVENLTTRDTGIYSLADYNKGKPEKKIMAAKSITLLGKAKDAEVVMLTATTFHDQPDIQTTDFSFKELRKVTDSNPQQAGMNWGSGELVNYRNADGVELQAAVYKPENFDPKKKYPLMVYIYERLSQNVNSFVRPAPGTSINMAYYVSNGYIVLTPDIVYTTGHPGQSALKCVLPAIQSLVEKGYVDRNNIGIQGHSWGGYQIAYMVTQTNVFKAAEAGAPVVNMISAYDGIRWGTGLPRQFQYEKTQSRIGGTPWEYPLRFIENSSIFMADRVTTPLLILQNDADDAVPWYQGIEMFLALRRLGKEVYLFDYNGEPHGLRKRSAQKDYAVRMQQYFDHFLKGAPAPEWMEKGIPYIEREQEKEKFNSVYTSDTVVKP
jgi:dipeptidyl aminopeptidase/acylaminoacyl peptidase